MWYFVEKHFSDDYLQNRSERSRNVLEAEKMTGTKKYIHEMRFVSIATSLKNDDRQLSTFQKTLPRDKNTKEDELIILGS